MVGYALGGEATKAVWLDFLLSEKFYAACVNHLSARKNEKNMFCVDCRVGICQHCVSDHTSHRLLQIRRYVYHDVIRLHDLQKLVDCTRVQAYVINSARAVFLNQRPQLKSSKMLGNSCQSCERSLQDAYRFCSLACKVKAIWGNDDQQSNCLLPRTQSDYADRIDFGICSLPGRNSDDYSQKSTSSTSDSRSTANSAGDVWPAGAEAAKSFGNNNTAVTAGISANHGTLIQAKCSANLKARSLIFPGAATSPRSVISNSSFKRRKSKPQRSPFC